ncbi:MAG: hypothetical protein R3F14_25400 [Polyangiaceae bacterium]
MVLASAACLGFASSGCFFIDHDHDHGDGWDDTGDPPVTDPPDTPATISAVNIQPDRVLEATPGEGVGIFVEYQTGGFWKVWTTCDTFTSKQVCSFDIFASTREAKDLRVFGTEDVEGFDQLIDLGNGAVELLADTDSDTDALLLEVEPGAPLDLEVYIDGQSAQPFVYWVSDDVIHAGAPDNPVRFVPAL